MLAFWAAKYQLSAIFAKHSEYKTNNHHVTSGMQNKKKGILSGVKDWVHMKTAKMVQDFNWLCNLDVNHKRLLIFIIKVVYLCTLHNKEFHCVVTAFFSCSMQGCPLKEANLYVALLIIGVREALCYNRKQISFPNSSKESSNSADHPLKPGSYILLCGYYHNWMKYVCIHGTAPAYKWGLFMLKLVVLMWYITEL